MSELINNAKDFAALAHDNQFRKWTGELYINHPQRVAARVEAEGGTEDEIAAAWLHDVVEDCGVPIYDIEQGFGWNISTIVFELTKPQQAITQSGMLVKLCDIADNMSDLKSLASPEEARIYAAKKQAQFEWIDYKLVGHDVLKEFVAAKIAEALQA